MSYGKKDGLKNYNLTPGTHDTIGIGLLLTKIEFWSFQYDFSFQFWGVDNNNAYIMRGDVEIASFGGFETIKGALERVIEFCEKSNPRIKYPNW